MAEDDAEAHLVRSLVEERILLLGRLKAYKDAFDKVLILADVALTKPGKNEALLRIRELAKEALTL